MEIEHIISLVVPLLILVLFFAILLTFICIPIYNQIIRLRKNVDNSTGSINAMLKRRYDLIPNLVEVAKTHMKYEANTLNKLTLLRTEILEKKSPKNKLNPLDNEIQKTVDSLMISVEKYPDLKFNSSFVYLQTKWAEIEDDVSASRRFYNNNATEYNIAISTFPKLIVAKALGFKTLEIFNMPQSVAAGINAKEFFDNPQ